MARWALFAGLLLACSGGNAPAGVIRDDRDDSVYVAMAKNPSFAASGRLVVQVGTGIGTCSATLIAPDWILTAGHCAVMEDGPNTAQTFIINTPAGLASHTIRNEDVYVLEDWITGAFDLNSGHDLALMKLETPVRGVKPAILETSPNVVGKVFTTVGYGSTGTGRTGNVAAAGTLRAGQNVFDATRATIRIPGYAFPYEVGSPRTVLYDFDSPSRDRSTLGATSPLNLEYSAAPGDSGGAAFVQSGGAFRIAGVVSGGIRPLALRNGAYGTTAIYVRVSQHADWIESVLAGGAEPLPQMLLRMIFEGGEMAARVRARAQRLAAAGWAETRYLAPLPVAPAAPPPLLPHPMLDGDDGLWCGAGGVGRNAAGVPQMMVPQTITMWQASCGRSNRYSR
jgi:secreted trypsin-like serine protease